MEFFTGCCMVGIFWTIIERAISDKQNGSFIDPLERSISEIIVTVNDAEPDSPGFPKFDTNVATMDDQSDHESMYKNALLNTLLCSQKNGMLVKPRLFSQDRKSAKRPKSTYVSRESYGSPL